MVITSEFWKENIKPIIFLCFGVLLISLIGLKFIQQKEALDKEFAKLVKHGKIIEGEIVDFEPYSHIILRNESFAVSSWGGRGYQGIAVKIICKTLNNKEIAEDWNYGLKDRFKVGDSVSLYYWDKNVMVKLASVHHPKVAMLLITKSRMDDTLF